MATSNNSSVTLIARGNIRPNTIAIGGGKGGVSNYELLTHKPSINGHELIGNKTNADLGIPTDTQDLTNTAGFITKIVDDLVNYYTKLEIDDIINQIKQTSFRIVDDLPLVGDPGVIYLILNSTPQSRNYYDEYIYVDNRWEKIGTTEIDLSGYVTDEELTQVLRNYITNETLNETLRNYYNKADVNEMMAGKADSADLATVATSGSYNDLSNKPDIPDELADLSEDSTHRVVTDTEKETWNNKSDFSGSYNDLTDKPDIPTVYNSTITIKKNNQNIDSFTLNQSSNKSINMDVPEKTSDIQNDSGFITNTVNNLANYYLKSETYTKTEVSNLINAAVSGRFQKVNALPAQGEENVIYLVPKATVLVDNIYDEYIWEDGSWELIGDTQIDLSGYVTDADLTAALQNYVTSATFNATISNYYTKTEVGNLLADKVDKVDGKGLSTYDYDAVAKAVVDSVTANLATKVDKVDGKGLSTNDYTTADKNKLAGIAEGAEVNVQSDWDETDDTQDDYIKNKPTKLSQFTNDSGFTKVESSTTNGNIKINGTETQVYDDSEIKEELSTDTTIVEGNPLNFTTLSAQTAQSTILSVEPIQDLHGYDNPWVGGAGKNKLLLTVDGIKAANTSGTWSGNAYTLRQATFTILTDSDNNVIGINVNGTPNGGNVNFRLNQVYDIPQGNYILSDGMSQHSNNFNLTTYKNDSWVAATNSSDNVAFTVDSDGDIRQVIYVANGTSVNNVVVYPMIRLSDASAGFVSYTNICPISGRSEIGILGCGKNVFDKDKLSSENGYLDVNGNFITHQYWKVTEYIPVDGDNIIYNGLISPGESPKACWYDKYKNFISSFAQSNNITVLNIPSNAQYLRMSIKPADDMNRLMVYYDGGNTYEPYTKSNDLTISLGQTVYGGTLDVENGVLVVDRASVDLGSLDFSPSTAESHIFRSDSIVNLVKPTVDKYTATNAISSIYYHMAWGPISASDNGRFAIASINDDHAGRLDFIDHRYSTVGDFVAGVTGETLCYELKNPVTIQLTPNEISLLKGVNNISTTGDKITLTYRNGKFATLDGAIPKMTFRGEDYTMGVDDIGLFLKNLTKSTKTYITDPLLNFDGTVATYKKIMKQWFINNGVNIMDSTGITYLCERWYEITKQGWKGGTSFPAVGVSTGSTGTRFDDNVDMSVTPSTDTSANTDTYQGLPLFAITDCNWELDSDGNILITAIDGITDNFVRDDPTKFVGVMQQTGWVKKVDDASAQKYYYADDKDAYEDLVPLPEAIKLDGTVRSFVVHAKYMSGIVDSKMTCCSGVIPRRNISHDGLVTLPDNIGTQYSGGTSVDWSFLVWMQRIKYASLTSDGVLQGCCNYNYQYYVKVSETGVKRLILSSANGANLKVGSTITFGAYAGNADRGQAATYSISGQDGAIITAIEDVMIDSTTYKAIYVDTTSTFDTVANGDATNGTTIVSTHHWVSGSCDNVKGNDGSPVSATNGIYPAKLQGIEYMVGGYEVFADVIMNISGGYYNPYYARKSTDQATSITSSMVQSTLKCAQPSSDAWRYIQKHGFDGDIFYPVSTGTSSSEYMKDGFYENGTSTSTGTREWLAFGDLGNGSGAAGLSFLNGSTGLGTGGWLFVARLSCNGNRGILLTA